VQRTVTEFGAESAFCFMTEFLWHSAAEFFLECAFRFIKWNISKKCGAPPRNLCRSVLFATCIGQMCFLLRNCGVPVCKYGAERRIISKIGDQFNYRVQGVKKSIATYRAIEKFKNLIRNMKSTLLYPPMALTHNFFLWDCPFKPIAKLERIFEKNMLNAIVKIKYRCSYFLKKLMNRYSDARYLTLSINIVLGNHLCITVRNR